MGFTPGQMLKIPGSGFCMDQRRKSLNVVTVCLCGLSQDGNAAKHCFCLSSLFHSRNERPTRVSAVKSHRFVVDRSFENQEVEMSCHLSSFATCFFNHLYIILW